MQVQSVWHVYFFAQPRICFTCLQSKFKIFNRLEVDLRFSFVYISATPNQSHKSRETAAPQKPLTNGVSSSPPGEPDVASIRSSSGDRPNAAPVTLVTHGEEFTTEDKIKERVTLKQWDPVCWQIYQITAVPPVSHNCTYDVPSMPSVWDICMTSGEHLCACCVVVHVHVWDHSGHFKGNLNRL